MPGGSPQPAEPPVPPVDLELSDEVRRDVRATMQAVKASSTATTPPPRSTHRDSWIPGGAPQPAGPDAQVPPVTPVPPVDPEQSEEERERAVRAQMRAIMASKMTATPPLPSKRDAAETALQDMRAWYEARIDDDQVTPLWKSLHTVLFKKVRVPYPEDHWQAACDIPSEGEPKEGNRVPSSRYN